jgi:hypothetical protein
MKLLTPGPGNKGRNTKAATEYITSKLLEAESVDLDSGRLTTSDGNSYQVSVYADTPAALVSTPNVAKTQESIYASGLKALLFRQLKRDKRSFVYEVDPETITRRPNSSTAEWTEVSKAATRIWICSADEVRLIDKTK